MYRFNFTAILVAGALLVPTAASAQALSAPIDDTSLAAIAGREDIALVAESKQTATVTGNSVGSNVATGDLRISDQAFESMSGLSVISVNTGNNVAINSSMNVTVNINPGQ